MYAWLSCCATSPMLQMGIYVADNAMEHSTNQQLPLLDDDAQLSVG